jgi:hypothetical protein
MVGKAIGKAIGKVAAMAALAAVRSSDAETVGGALG